MNIAPLIAGLALSLAADASNPTPHWGWAPESPQQGASRLLYFGDPDKPDTRLALYINERRMDPPQLSPRKFNDIQWEFEWVVGGQCRIPNFDQNFHTRFRIFSQVRKQDNDKGIQIARTAVRLWDYNMQRLKIDHSRDYNSQIVDFYLCWGGVAGGEQFFDRAVENGFSKNVNTIYIYDMASFTDPVEMLREVCHEYGHATLPGMGGFLEPEAWGNGFFGERLYMRWLRDDLVSAKLKPVDMMNVSEGALDKWVRQNIEIPVLRVAADGPQFNLLDGTGKDSMDAYLALASYAECILPAHVFGLSIKINGSFKAKDYPAAIVNACLERGNIVVSVPKFLEKKDLWVPLGPKGTITGGQVLKRNGSWAQVRPQTGALTLHVKE